MVVFDTSVVAVAFDETASVPLDPLTDAPMQCCKERIDFLLSGLASKKVRVLFPAPVIAEYLVRGGPDKVKRLEIFTSNKNFLVAPFDLKSAILCSEIEDADAGKSLSEAQAKSKVKFDRQIIAIALAQGADTIYTGDWKLGARAADNGLKVVYTWDIPFPPQVAQLSIEGVQPVATPTSI